MPIGAQIEAPVGRGGGARQVIEGRILTALVGDGPSYVLFSGGRDSSAVLALAVLVARREGLPDPVPVTIRHPESPESDETSWQEVVLEHLDVQEHIVVEMHGEQSLLGGAATSAMHRRGPIWPSAAQLQGALLRHLEPGVVISGEGGDIVLAGHRVGAVRAAISRPGRSTLRRAAVALRPSTVTRRSRVARLSESGGVPPWLHGQGREAYIRAMTNTTNVPLRWDSAVRRLARDGATAVALSNFAGALAEYGSLSVNPLFELPFVDALACDGGPLGWGDRTAIFRQLVGDLLPDPVLSRRTKAAFNSTRWGERERQFAHDWDGSGFDDTWIDAKVLRREWLSERPLPLSGFLLQVAWAISEGIPVTEDRA